LEKDPAYLPIDKVLDLKNDSPRGQRQSAAFSVEKCPSGFDGGTNDPLQVRGIDLPDLIKDVKLIRVVVIEAKTQTAPLWTRV